MNEEYTAEALLQKAKNTSTIFARFVLTISKYGQDAVYCFVEGNDMPYYRAPIEYALHMRVVPFNCGGKDFVISANRLIEQKEEYKCFTKRYFVDRDYTSNDNVPDSIWITEGYAIENYYLTDSCVSKILEDHFKINSVDTPKNYKKCMDLYHAQHQLFDEAILLFNAWYCSLFENPKWNRKDVCLEDKFPDKWLNPNIGHISAKYTLEDIEKKFPSAPKISQDILNKKIVEMREKGWFYMRGHYEMEFLFVFLSFLKDEPKKKRKYTIQPCSLQFNQKSMIPIFSQYAHVPECLIKYIKTGSRSA